MKTRWLLFSIFAAATLPSRGQPPPVSSNPAASPAANVRVAEAGVAAGRALFLKNCAHCHGSDARGDEGPDLHNLSDSDEWIAGRINKGKAGQMTAFAGKLQPAETKDVIAYLRTLK